MVVLVVPKTPDQVIIDLGAGAYRHAGTGGGRVSKHGVTSSDTVRVTSVTSNGGAAVSVTNTKPC